LDATEENWHTLVVADVFKKLSTTENGLTGQEAQDRLTQYGPNVLPKEKPFSSLKIFASQFKSPLIYFLILAGIVTLILSDYTDAIVIFLAVLLNSIVGFFQENKASKALEKLKEVLKIKATVIRDGSKKEVFQEYIVPGDAVIIKAGDKIPADVRIFEAKNLKVNEAILTGESIAVDKNVNIVEEGLPISDRTNILYMGTLVEDGFAKAIVTQTGAKTEIGKIAQLVKEIKDEKTPYQKKLINFGRLIGIIIIGLSLAIFILGLLRDTDFIEIFTTSVAIAVAAIPEGLPIAMTVVLALGMQKILKRKGLVRHLSAAEALGSTSIICVDKTGTLTEGKMELAHILTGTKELLYDGSQNFNEADEGQSHSLALRIASLCSEAYIENPQDEMVDWVIRGRPTDRALTYAAIQFGITKEDFEKDHPSINKLEFSPDRKISASLNHFNENENILYIMGVPEKIVQFSSSIELDGVTEKLDVAKANELESKFHYLLSKGLRVLATAYKKESKQVTEIREDLFSDLVFVGFLALRDPLRPETLQAMTEAKQAGLRPIIVTGDHRLTAKAIAQELNLPHEDQNIIEGAELENLTDEEFAAKIEAISIYARVEPAQKLKIIAAWQAKGMIVAMTGDGINDTPALKKADIGLALGSGTDVAKEVSDIVLLDDNFSVIVSAIEEGRAIIDNIRKSIVYLISDSFSEVALIGLSLFFGLPLPVLAAQILWINLIEDGLPTIALGFEKKEKDLMKRRPFSKDLPLLTRDMKLLIFIIAVLSVAILMLLYWYLLNFSGYEIIHIRSTIFAAMALITLFNVFLCKTFRKNIWQVDIFSNIFLSVSFFAGVIALIGALYLPILQELVRTVPLNLKDWLVILFLTLINVIFIEALKYYLIAKKNNDEKSL